MGIEAGPRKSPDEATHQSSEKTSAKNAATLGCKQVARCKRLILLVPERSRLPNSVVFQLEFSTIWRQAMRHRISSEAGLSRAVESVEVSVAPTSPVIVPSRSGRALAGFLLSGFLLALLGAIL